LRSELVLREKVCNAVDGGEAQQILRQVEKAD
jgi:hypothetical protein